MREVIDNKKPAHMATSAGHGRAWSDSGDRFYSPGGGSQRKTVLDTEKEKEKKEKVQMVIRMSSLKCDMYIL